MSKTNSRFFFMDSMRGILMMLGVLLHSAQVYNPENVWLIHNQASADSAQYLVDFIHAFRMPAFFIVAGFFTLLTVEKYGIDKSLKIRGERIFIPLVATALTLNSLQTFLLHANGWKQFDLLDYLRDGQWISHLWFLIFLLFFTLVVYAWGKTAKFVPFRIVHHADCLIDRLSMGTILLALPAWHILLQAFGKAMPGIYHSIGGIFSFYELGFYLQFFLFGIALRRYENLFREFSRMTLFSVLLFFASLVLVLQWNGDEQRGLIMILQEYTRMLVVWLGCHLVFCIFKAFFSKPSRIAIFMSDASYSVYLFHHFLVVAFGLVFVRLGFGGDGGLVVLAAVVLLVSISMHAFIVSRSNILSYLFNGRRRVMQGRNEAHAATEALPEYSHGK